MNSLEGKKFGPIPPEQLIGKVDGVTQEALDEVSSLSQQMRELDFMSAFTELAELKTWPDAQKYLAFHILSGSGVSEEMKINAFDYPDGKIMEFARNIVKELKIKT